MAYEDKTVEELKEELNSRDLKVSGTKDELVARLEADDEAPASDDEVYSDIVPVPTGERDEQGRELFNVKYYKGEKLVKEEVVPEAV